MASALPTTTALFSARGSRFSSYNSLEQSKKKSWLSFSLIRGHHSHRKGRNKTCSRNCTLLGSTFSHSICTYIS
ncbi:hypothetical protein V5799_020205 [Amblyomma americanum]|uniref:Uncharacterized protein n=1 Tax=Amblyomma americanum TaxID=6943 RepID=A0AAQ4EUV4_AMBAM